mgnify:FL=1
MRFGTTVEGFADEEGGVRVRLSDGSTESAQYLVGADGARSRVRELAFGTDPGFLRDLGYVTAAFLVERLPVGVAPDRLMTLTEPGRQVSLYPVPGGRSAAFLIHRALPGPPREQLASAYGTMGWVVPALLEQCPAGDRLFCDGVFQVVLQRWVRGRVVLVGDAAGCVSLLAGRGASLAMAEAETLAPALAEGSLPGWESRWRPIVEAKQAEGRRAARWFVPRTRLELRLRDALLRRATRFPISWFLRRSLRE